jgi:methionyl-tRNA formyltransferase
MSKPTAILMGSKPGSVVALRAMLEAGWTVPFVVVTRSVRHDWFGGPTLEEAAKRAGLRVVSQKDLPRDVQVDFVISYMYRYLVQADVLNLATRAALNFHAAPLPRFGGWAFYNVAILEGVNRYGVTCHYMDQGFDTGPLLQVRWFDIDADQHTAISLERRAQAEMVQLFRDFMGMAEPGKPLPREPQDPAQMRYMTQEEFMALKEIPAGASPEDVDRIARAFWYPPYQGAYIIADDVKVEIVPPSVKEGLAALLQQNTYHELCMAAGLTVDTESEDDPDR